MNYEPVDSGKAYAVMGILTGDAACRGRKVAAVVLRASANWLTADRSLSQVVLCVSRNHTAALREHLAVGFGIENTPRLPGPRPNLFILVWHL